MSVISWFDWRDSSRARVEEDEDEKDSDSRDMRRNRVPDLPPHSPLSPSEKILQGNAMLEWAKTELGIVHYMRLHTLTIRKSEDLGRCLV